MKTKLFTLFLVLLTLVGIDGNVYGQVSGDYRSKQSGGWAGNAIGTAVVTSGALTNITITSGGSGYSTAPAITFHNAASGVAATAVLTGSSVTSVTITTAGTGGNATQTTALFALPSAAADQAANWETYNGTGWVQATVLPSTSNNVTIRTGHTITISNVTGNCNNLTIESGATLNAPNVALGNVQTLLVNGNILNNGVLGTSSASQARGEGIRINLNGSSPSISGTGVTNIAGIAVNNNNAITQDIVIAQSMELRRNSSTNSNALSLQNGSNGSAQKILTINSGIIVKIPNSGGFHGTQNSSITVPTNTSGNMTYNVYGTLDCSNAQVNLYTTNNASSTSQALTVNVKNGGTFILGSTIRLYTALSGQSSTINPESGSIVQFNGSVTPSFSTTTGTGIAPTFPTSFSNLTLNNSAGVTLPAATTVTNALNLTSGTLALTAGSLTVNSGATVTSSGGKLAAAPSYGGNLPFVYNGSGATTGGYEIAPSSGGLSSFTVNGSGTYTTSYAAIVNGDITASSGILKMGASLSCQNVSIASGATLNADNGASSQSSRRTLTVGNGTADNDATITVNGTFGSATRWSNDGIDVEVHANAKTLNIAGSGGTIGFACLRPAANANARTLDITLNQSMTLNRDNGGAANIEPALTLQNNTGTYARTLTIPSGVTVTLRGNGGLHGLKNYQSSSDELTVNYASSALNQGNCTYNINGTLDLTYYNAICNLNTCSFSGNTQSVTVNVGSTGTLKLANILKMYTALSGQSVSIVPAAGSTIEYGYNGTPTFLMTTGTGVAPTLPSTYGNLKINNTSGITLPASATVNETLTLTAGAISTGANTLTLKGAVSGSGTINTGASGILAFGGSSEQSLSASNLTTGSVNNLTINAGSKLTTSGTITASAINILSSASGTGTLINGGTMTNTNASVQQYLPDARNWYVSSPVSKATAPGGFTYYSYDETGQNPSPVAPSTAYWVSVAPGADLNKGVGYIALPSTVGSTLTFTTKTNETLNTGNVDVALTRSGATKTGFNLIGNPYPCHLGWTYDFVNANSSLIESSIWVRTNAGTTNNSGQWSFATFNATSSESVPSVVNNGVIAPMQAFWVRAKTAGTLTLNSNLTKSHQSSNPLKVRAATYDHRQRIRLEVSNGTATDESLIFFDAAASNGYDDYDSPKMTNNNVDIPEIYTVVNGQKLVMNGMNGIINDMEIPIGFTTGKSNTFTLKTTQLANLDADVKVFLKDNSNSNLLTELNLNQEYTFTSDITDNVDRFSLVFKAPSLATADNFIQNQSIRVFNNENNRILVENNLSIDNATMSVYNVSGQLEETKKLTGNMTISNLSYGNGVYFVTISFGNKTETTKLIINNI